MPSIRWVDIVEILLIAFLMYHILVWVKNTRAWSLLKGIIVIAVFILIAAYFQMNTILWIVQNAFGVAVTAVVAILQPELRKALEELGQKNIISSIIPFETNRTSEEGRFSDKTINEITKACVEMGKVKTGALIVINIFEKNTPLHDGAVIVRGNRITSATCYLPLSDNMALSKDLGTRHRAGVGISEATDSMTVIVSEETGKISVAYKGELERSLDGDRLKERLKSIQNKPEEEPKKRILWKGRSKSEK